MCNTVVCKLIVWLWHYYISKSRDISDIKMVSNFVFLFSSSSVLTLAQATVMLGGLHQRSLMKLPMGKALLTILNHPYLH